MNITTFITFAGGIGLFLLGMRLMSDGLKVAAGPALRELLARATRSRLRALGSGALITALVQSSSAVIFSTIGFVNAGLLTLGQAIGIIFGANLGTTLTSWIVAIAGFNVNLQALALPAVAIGMAGWIAGRGRGVAMGQALVGFGVFFLGLDVLKGAFTGAEGMFALAERAGDGPLRIGLFTVIGALMTLLMQSSSAALAVTLTAAASGMLPLPAAAAMVVGANVGTTSTAVFATIGATSPARRVAAAHVAFNLVAALGTLATLPWLLALAKMIAGHDGPPSTLLAIFHTLSNLLGVLLIWPFTDRLVATLERHFGEREQDPALPHHLDRAVAATPRLAIDALALESARIGSLAQQMARTALVVDGGGGGQELQRQQQTIESLGAATIDFTRHVNSGGDPEVDAALPDAVRVVQYYRAVAELALELSRMPSPSPTPPSQLGEPLRALQDMATRALTASDPTDGAPLDAAAIDAAVDALEQVYADAKAELLRAGSRGMLPATSLVRMLDRISMTRRMVEQACKGGRFLARLAPQPAAT